MNVFAYSKSVSEISWLFIANSYFDSTILTLSGSSSAISAPAQSIANVCYACNNLLMTCTSLPALHPGEALASKERLHLAAQGHGEVAGLQHFWAREGRNEGAD